MIIHDCHLKGVTILPLEADAPLIIDADAMLAGSVSM